MQTNRQYSYDPSGRLIRATGEVLPWTFGLPDTTADANDDHGNLTAMPHMPTTTGIQGMAWDDRDQLQRTRHGTGAGTRYVYYPYDGTTLDEQEISLHVNDGARRFVIIDERDSTRVTRYQLGDHLGSACVELDEGEEELSYEEYHRYGTLAVRLWSTGNGSWSRKRYRYTG